MGRENQFGLFGRRPVVGASMLPQQFQLSPLAVQIREANGISSLSLPMPRAEIHPAVARTLLADHPPRQLSPVSRLPQPGAYANLSLPRPQLGDMGIPWCLPTNETLDGRFAQGLKPSGVNANAEMYVSKAGQDFIRGWEQGPNGGPASTPYRSVERGRNTIGWGHKLQRGEKITRLDAQQAEDLFQKDLERHAQIVRNTVRVPLSQQQFDALVSLAYTAPQGS